MCDSATYQVTPDQFTALKAKLVAGGVTVPDGNSGTLTGHGVTAQCSYDGSSNLTIQVTSKPWIVSCGHCREAIAEFIQEVQQPPAPTTTATEENQ